MDKQEFEKIINYSFSRVSLLNQALTHTSYANEKFHGPQSHLTSNQRLEFLGDSVLSIVVSTYLYNNFPEMPEGELSKLRAAIVCEGSLNEFGKRIRINEMLLLGIGEEHTGGREKPSIIADAFESLIAAIYLDGGIEAATEFILSNIRKDIHSIAENYKTSDCKTNLQEIMSKRNIRPVYEIMGHEGPEHDRYYIARVTCGDDSTFGKGRSKKEAEQRAAKEMLAHL